MLSKKAKEAIKENQVLQAKLGAALPLKGEPRSFHTILRWVYQDDTIMLTTAAALQVIREETGMTDDEILEKENAA